MIEIQLEDVGGTSWWRSLLATLGGRNDAATMRFVAREVGGGEESSPPVAVGPTFRRPHGVRDDVVPDEAGCPGMSDSLETLHEALAARGWRRSGHGEEPWSDRFTRVVVADS